MAEWQLEDYLLRGLYCPRTDLIKRLRTCRRHGLAAVIVFTVCDGDLTHEPVVVPEIADDVPPPFRQVLDALLRAEGELYRAVSEAVFLSKRRRRAALAAAAAGVAALLGPYLPDDADVFLTTPDDMEPSSPVRPVALMIGARPLPAPSLEQLYAMLVTSVQVRQVIDQAALSPLDQLLLIPSVKPDGGIDMGAMTRRAIERVISDTDSNAGAIHWHARGDSAGSDPAEVAAILDGLGRDPLELLAKMHKIHRAAQYVGSAGIVLACPIPGVLAGPQSPAAGVLLVRRADRVHYSSHTLARCRAICIRLSVVRATADASEVVRLIADLSSPSAAAAVRGVQGAHRSDLELALDGLTPMLERIADVTNSHSVTLRLVRGVVDSVDAHGLVLERATTAPTPGPEMAGRLPRQAESVDRGLNWEAVRTGEPVAAADVTDHNSYHRLRDGTRSQLSLPVRMGARLVGTLNLESASTHNYGTFEPYGRLIADAVGRRLAAASMIVSQPVIERAAQVLDHTHGYRNKLRLLRDTAMTLPLDESERRRIVSYVDECVGLIDSAVQAARPPRDVEPVGQDHARVNVGKIMQHELDTNVVDGLEYLNDWSDVAALHRTLPDAASGAVGVAVHGIITNIKKHSRRRYGQSAPTVWFGECTWDGGPHAVIVFTNPTRISVPPDIAAQVYRTPVQRPGTQGELQLGAYLTGLALRPANGWVTFAAEQGLARTVLFFPVPDEETVP